MRRRCTWAGIGILSFVVALTSSPALSQFVCTTTPSDINCTNSGTAPTAFTNDAAGANQNATTTNSGIANRFTSQTDGGGNATATNTGSDTGGVVAQTTAGGNATATNSGTNTGNIAAVTLDGGNAVATNSGSNIGNNILARTVFTGNATATNSGSNVGLLATITQFDGDATTINSGSNIGQVSAVTEGGGNAAVINSGNASGGIAVETTSGGNATAINSGSTPGIAVVALAGGNATAINSGTSGPIVLEANSGNAAVTNSGIINGLGFPAIQFLTGRATLTDIVGGRVIGAIDLAGGRKFCWRQLAVHLQHACRRDRQCRRRAVRRLRQSGRGARSHHFRARRSLADELYRRDFANAARPLRRHHGRWRRVRRSRLCSRFGITNRGSSAGGIFGIPSVAMSYASSGSRPVLGKAAAPALPYYDTTVWAGGFGGERKQRADGDILPTNDTAFGGAMGVDRVVNSNLRSARLSAPAQAARRSN
jgi:hypothetical protein